MNTVTERTSRYFSFTTEEIFALAATIAVSSFVMGFFAPGDTSQAWINNFILTFVVIAISIILQVSCMKIASLHQGYRLTYQFGRYSSLFSVLLILLSYAFFFGAFYIPFFAPGFFRSKQIRAYRLGKYPPGMNIEDLGFISLFGSFCSLSIALVFSMLKFLGPANPIIQKVILINALLGIWNFLPIPEFNGFYLFLWSTLKYIFNGTLVVAMAILILAGASPAITLLGALTIAVIVWAIYVFTKEFK